MEENMEGRKSVVPFVGMVMVQVAQVGLMIVGKEAMSDGMTNFTFVFYSNSLASLVLLPTSFLIHSYLVQISGYAGIQYTSPSFASAMLNLIPGFTFIFAIIFRMEKLDYTSSSIAKSIGTVVSITGAFIVTLYKGPSILMTPTHSKSAHQHLLMHLSTWVVGGLLLTVDAALTSMYNIVQVLILRKFPAELIIVFFYCFSVAILSAAVAFIVEKDSSAWSLQPNIRLFAVVYSGVFGSVFQVSVTTWCLHRTGPLFVAMFHPLGIVIANVLGIIFLGDTFYLGSLVGSIVIVIGFYSVMWGKAKEGKMVGEIGVNSLDSTSENVSLLQSNVQKTEA
ncbi:WAT1-related protein At5g40230-like isoform X2 [Cornus florida]|uniref:WAT1-related protein At5g40230-like isoform X2 n=1 Tax=Cornus florida TaxID=4283 RepID=UPI002898986A|nr:WAT1-related protein At5g40230-like isoform X2 [Cornus florida]